jgi:antitoxin component YwqK of YwqJK toxin-antitoxin module
MNDCATKLELANAKIKFKVTPSFHDNGNPRSGILEADQAYEGIRQDNGSYIKLKGGEYIMFFSNGKLLSAILAEDCIIKGLYCKAGTKIEYYEGGKLRYYTPTNNINITLEDEKGSTKPDTVMAGAQVEYYEGGRIRSYISAKTGKFVQLSDNGNSH